MKNETLTIDQRHIKIWDKLLETLEKVLERDTEFSTEEIYHLASTSKMIQEGQRLALDVMTAFETEQIEMFQRRLEIYKRQIKKDIVY